MNPLIFGNNDQTNIVNISLKNDHVSIYSEALSGEISVETFPYTPWVLTATKIRPRSERLKGDQFWRFITSTTCEKFINLQQRFQRELWMPRNIEECFLLCEGYTYFKGMKVTDVSILSFDIETSGLAHNTDSRVFIISNTFRKKGAITKKLFSIDDYQDNEHEMIKAWCAWVREVNPSIMCGHNVMSFDLPYLSYCYTRQTHQDLPLGRDGSEIQYEERTSKFRKDGSQQYEFHNAKITGREIVDTFFLSIKYDLSRDFPSYGLKPIVKFLGMEKEGRTFIDASKIRQHWPDLEMRAKIKQYALEDSEDSLKLFDKMIPSYFYMNQSIPKTLQQMINEASGSHLDALMIRSYLQDGYSQPRTSIKTKFEGAISMGIPGIYEHVCKADVVSLYPSIMLEYNIYDSKKDPNRHMLRLLDYFRTERIKNKDLAKQTGDQYYDDLQNSQKILINSIFGFLGANYLLYNYPDGGSEVTKRGREILLKGVEWATGHTLKRVISNIVNANKENEKIEYEWVLGDRVCEGRGYTLTGVDTDAFSVTKNVPMSKQEFEAELVELNKIYSSLITWSNDGLYDKFIVLKAKNYVMCNNGKVKYKGSGLTDQKKEPAITELLKNIVKSLLNDKNASLTPIYHQYIKEVMDIQDIFRWSTKKTVTKVVLDACDPEARLTERKIYNALKHAVQQGVLPGIQEGDKTWLYNAIDGEEQVVLKGQPVYYKDGAPKMVPKEILKDYRLWTRDQDVDHYLKRLYDAVQLFDGVIDLSEFKNYTLKSNKKELYSLTNVSQCDIMLNNG